jgi:hypothetical protein
MWLVHTTGTAQWHVLCFLVRCDEQARRLSAAEVTSSQQEHYICVLGTQELGSASIVTCQGFVPDVLGLCSLAPPPYQQVNEKQDQEGLQNDNKHQQQQAAKETVSFIGPAAAANYDLSPSAVETAATTCPQQSRSAFVAMASAGQCGPVSSCCGSIERRISYQSSPIITWYVVHQQAQLCWKHGGEVGASVLLYLAAEAC